MQNLPPILMAYFEAANAQNVAAFVAFFTPDAKIKDESNTHEGHENIATWNRHVNEKYNCKNTIKSWVQTKNGIEVTAEVSGTFPGSPIDLTFRFTLQDGKISALEIG